MRVRIGVTDWDWYTFLSGTGATEVNFWQPSGGPRVQLPLGSPFLFKSKFDRGNRIVGGGFFNGWVSLPLMRAWEIFKTGNGTASFNELERLILKYRERHSAPRVAGGLGPEIGCVMLRDVRFLTPDESLAAPPDWPKQAVQGKNYDLSNPEHGYLETVLARALAMDGEPGWARVDITDVPASVAGEVFGDPRLSPVRLGQAAFKALVQESYSRRCAITGDKVLPVLQAAHIRPVSESGQNRLDNGLLLRSDVHTLFDRGYLSVHPERRSLEVSPRLRSDWGNGDEFYRRAASGEAIRVPLRQADQPNREFLTWHREEVFMAS